MSRSRCPHARVNEKIQRFPDQFPHIRVGGTENASARAARGKEEVKGKKRRSSILSEQPFPVRPRGPMDKASVS